MPKTAPPAASSVVTKPLRTHKIGHHNYCILQRWPAAIVNILFSVQACVFKRFKLTNSVEPILKFSDRKSSKLLSRKIPLPHLSEVKVLAVI